MFLRASWLGWICLLLSTSVVAEPVLQKITPDDFQIDFNHEPLPGEGLVLPEPAKQPDLDYLDQISFYLQAIDLVGIDSPLKEDLLAQVSSSIQQTQSVGDLYRLANRMTLYLMEKGFVLGRVILPAQTLSQGRVQYQVMLGKIAGLTVNGKPLNELEDDLIRNRLAKVQAQSITTSEVLSRQVMLINDLPGTSLTGQMRASETVPGAADLATELTQQPYDVFVKVNNFGDIYTGQYRYSYLFATNNLLGRHERLSMGASFSSSWGQLASLTLGYYAPVSQSDWFLSSSLFYSQSKPKADLEALKIEGTSYGLDVTGIYPLVRKLSANTNLQVGLSSYQSQQSTLFGINSDAKVIRLNMGLEGDYRDDFGFETYRLNLKQGLDFGYAGSRTQTAPQTAPLNFTKLEAGYSRKQNLYFESLSALLKLDFQWGKQLLLTTERASYGAENFGRGLTYSALSGDIGQAASFDVRYDLFKLAVFERLTPYVFSDYAKVIRKNKDPEPSQQAKIYGAGVEFQLAQSIIGQAFACKTQFKDKLNQSVHLQVYLKL